MNIIIHIRRTHVVGRIAHLSRHALECGVCYGKLVGIEIAEPTSVSACTAQ